MASQLYEMTELVPEYFKGRKEKLKVSSTVYVGNLSYFTTELQIYELFVKCGDIKRIIMGLNKNTKTPCGYYNKEDAHLAVNVLNNTMLDMRTIRVDIDTGFEEGRQFGRGYSGAQKRDEFNAKQDPERPNSFSKNKDCKILSEIRR